MGKIGTIITAIFAAIFGYSSYTMFQSMSDYNEWMGGTGFVLRSVIVCISLLLSIGFLILTIVGIRKNFFE